ncbi:MAG: hypothetical protein DRG40_04170, partial [Deltaproteobacteria bacterium]
LRETFEGLLEALRDEVVGRGRYERLTRLYLRGRGIFLEFLEGFEPSTPVALETILHLKGGTRFHRITGG